MMGARGSVNQGDFGFSLVELLVALVVSMILLAGLYSNFIMQSRVQHAQAGVVEVAEDLRMAAQVMQGELRLAQGICWDAQNTRVIYQPADSPVGLGACNTVDAANGAFDFRAANATHPSPYLCWDRPNDAGGCQELVRGLKAGVGFQVSPVTNSASDIKGLRTLTLVGVYKDHQGVARDWSIRFEVWPRNAK